MSIPRARVAFMAVGLPGFACAMMVSRLVDPTRDDPPISVRRMIRDLRIGTFAEEIAIDSDDIALKPRSLSFEEAAAVPLVALAAYWVAYYALALDAGERRLVRDLARRGAAV